MHRKITHYNKTGKERWFWWAHRLEGIVKNLGIRNIKKQKKTPAYVPVQLRNQKDRPPRNP